MEEVVQRFHTLSHHLLQPTLTIQSLAKSIRSTYNAPAFALKALGGSLKGQRLFQKQHMELHLPDGQCITVFVERASSRKVHLIITAPDGTTVEVFNRHGELLQPRRKD